MSSLEEVRAAADLIRKIGNNYLILLHCVSAYPANAADANLRAMQTMERAFDVPVGYSDHTLGVEVALAAVALGACVMEPDELRTLVSGVRTVEAALGHGRKEPAPCEAETASVARKSVVAARHIPAGAVLTEEMVALKRPGSGLHPSLLSLLLGRKARHDIPAGTLLTLEMLV